MSKRDLKIYFVLGEESGDALAADLVPHLRELAKEQGRGVTFHGLFGAKLEALGQKSLFAIEDIAVMGISAVAARFPTIVRRVYQTVSDIEAVDPDIVVLIDSPDFTHAVAKRVRKRLPPIPIINYICPSVWAWRPGRAKAMRKYIDHVLAILPFEPAKLEELNGPPATYIGHPMALAISSLPEQDGEIQTDKPRLLVLPGSRQSELNRMLIPFAETIDILVERGVEFEVVMPAVPHLKDKLIDATENWAVRPQIVDSADNDKVFPTATAALATSGTVTLQLALHGVPMVSAYKFDVMAKPFLFMVKTWSALLPNLIADRPFVPEQINDTVVPGNMARMLERLLSNTPERRVQIAGFKDVKKAMKTKRPPGELAAEVIFQYI